MSASAARITFSTLKATSPVPPATSRCRMPAKGCSFATSLLQQATLCSFGRNLCTLQLAVFSVLAYLAAAGSGLKTSGVLGACASDHEMISTYMSFCVQA